MSLDLDRMDLPELKQLRKQLDQTISSFQERAREKARDAAEAAAREHGFSLGDLVRQRGQRAGGARKIAQSRGGDAAPKFRHPENDQLTWSGRGRRPAWFNDALAGGHSEEDLLVT